MTIGEYIKTIRKKKGLTQKQLGDILGVSAAMIAQYETSKRQPKYETLKKIADALNVPISSLYTVPNSVTFGLVENFDSEYEQEIKKTFFYEYTKLNDSGRNKVAEYVADLAGNSKYLNESARRRATPSDQPDNK